MPTTRQQKLQVSSDKDGNDSLNTKPTATSSSPPSKKSKEGAGSPSSKKRKQSDAEVKEAEKDDEADKLIAEDQDNVENGQKEAKTDDGDHPPAAKAQKTEEKGDDGDDSTAKKEDQSPGNDNDKPATQNGSGDHSSAKKEQEPSSNATAPVPDQGTEKKLEGTDSGSAGSGQDDVKWEVLERGHIHFFYRPKVQSADSVDSSEPAAASIDQVQNFHMLLLPRASESSTAPAKDPSAGDGKSEQTGEKAKAAGIGARMIRLGKKRLPDPKAALANGDQPGGIGGDSSEAIWAVISDVAPTFDSLKDSLAERKYSTKTSGERVVQAARPVGRGWYILSLSQTDPPSSREVRLSYVLSHPSDEKDFGDVQDQLGLNKESSIRLQMRNPTLPATGAGAPPAGLDPSSRVELSDKELDQTFGGSADSNGGGTRYARPEQIDLFDRAGVELLMIKKKEQEAEGDLGMGDTHQKALEKLAAKDADQMGKKDVLGELKLDSQTTPPDALEGEWI